MVRFAGISSTTSSNLKNHFDPNAENDYEPVVFGKILLEPEAPRAPIIGQVYKVSYKPNPDRRHTRGKRGKNKSSVIAPRDIGKDRDRAKKALSKAKAYTNRGAVLKTKSHDPAELMRGQLGDTDQVDPMQLPVQPERRGLQKTRRVRSHASLALKRRIKLGFNNPRKERLAARRNWKRAFGEEPKKGEVVQEAATAVEPSYSWLGYKEALSLLTRYRLGKVIDPGPYKMLQSTYDKVNGATLRAIIAKKLVGIELNPGPSDCSFSQAKPVMLRKEQVSTIKGKSYCLECNELVSFNRKTKLYRHEPDGRDTSPYLVSTEAPATAAAACTSAQAAAAVQSVPTPPLSVKKTFREPEPAPTPDKIQVFTETERRTVSGYQCTSTDIDLALATQFYGVPGWKMYDGLLKPRSEIVTRGEKSRELTVDQRPPDLRNTEALPNPIQVKRVDYTGVRPYLAAVPHLGKLLVLARTSGSWYGFIYLALFLLKVANIKYAIFLVFGYWFFSTWYTVVTLFVCQSAYWTFIGMIKQTPLIWGDMTLTYCPAWVGSAITASGGRPIDIATAMVSIRRSSGLNMQDSVYCPIMLASARIAVSISETYLGFQERHGSSVAFSSTPCSPSSLTFETHSDNTPLDYSSENCVVGVREFLNICQRQRESISPTVTAPTRSDYQTSLGQQNARSRVARAVGHVARTSVDYLSEVYHSIPRSPVTEMTSTPSETDSTSESEETQDTDALTNLSELFEDSRDGRQGNCPSHNTS